jgi:hypothetical protein
VRLCSAVQQRKVGDDVAHVSTQLGVHGPGRYISPLLKSSTRTFMKGLMYRARTCWLGQNSGQKVVSRRVRRYECLNSPAFRKVIFVFFKGGSVSGPYRRFLVVPTGSHRRMLCGTSGHDWYYSPHGHPSMGQGPEHYIPHT